MGSSSLLYQSPPILKKKPVYFLQSWCLSKFHVQMAASLHLLSAPFFFFFYFLIDFQWKLFGTELATVCYIDMRFDHIVAPTTSSQVEKSVSTTLSPRNRSTHILYRWCTGNTHRGSRDLFTPAPSFFSSFPFVSCVFHGTLLINLPPWRPLINISIHFLVFRSPKRDPRSRDVLGGYLKSTAVRWTHSCATGLVSLLICTGH